MKFNINKEMVKTVGVAAGKIGKAIVIEGIKGVLLKSATNVITTAFDGGTGDVKGMTLDDYIGKKKKKVKVIKVYESASEKVEDEIAKIDIVEKQLVN